MGLAVPCGDELAFKIITTHALKCAAFGQLCKRL